MGLLKAIIRTAVEIPCAAVKDIFTFGGISIDRRPALSTKYREILDEIDKK